MQTEGKNIDDLFTRKLGNMAVAPPENGWNRIEEELNRRNHKERRKYWLAAASVVLLLGFAASFVLLQKAETPSYFKEPVLVSNQPTNINDKEPARQAPQTSQVSDIQPANTLPISKPTNPVTSQSDYNNIVQKPAQVQTVVVPLPGKHPVREVPVYSDSWEDIKHAQPMKINRLEFLSRKTDSQTPPDMYTNEKKPAEIPPNVLVYNDISPSIYEESVVNETFAKTFNRPANRWEITGQFAPTYSYRSVSKVPGNMSKSDFDQAESGLLSFTGGLKVAFNASRRFSVQVGVYYSQTGQSVKQVTPTKNMYASVSSNNTAKSLVRTSSGNATITTSLKSARNDNYANYFSDVPAKISQNAVAVSDRSQEENTNYKLIERVDYLEIPLLLRYKIIDSRFNLYVLGGVSTNILVDNNVFIDNGQNMVKEGSLLLIRPVNYSSTVGMGLSYNINRNLSVNLEPSFKYYLQSYTTNNSISSNPYSLGIFTGIVCRF